MSENQEMEFADPAWQPRVTQEFDHEQNAPAPQPEWSPAPGVTAATNAPQQSDEVGYDYAQGYRAQPAPAPEPAIPFQRQQPPFQGQQQPLFQPQQPWHRRLPTWAWWLIGILIFSSIVEPATSEGGAGGSIFGLLIIAFAIFVGWLLYTRRLRVNLSGEAQPAETRTFEVGALPTIVINNKAGSIRLHAGQQGAVSITTTKRGYLFSQQWNHDAQVLYNQNSATNTVTARVDSWKLFGKTAIDFDIIVPPQASLNLVTNAGNVSVQNVAGQMKLQSDAGSINATQVALRGNSRLKTDAGTITFDGSLEPAGDYEFSTDLGTINATLPADASFNLNAKTDLGTITTNLPITQSQRTKASGQVGTGPYPRLKLKTDLGSIQVNRR
mgnify:CR=1 FL=1